MIGLLNEFLKDNNLSLDNITETEAKKIILFAINQFFNKKISIPLISSLANQILYVSFWNKNKSIEDVDLVNVLEILSELDYNQKNKPDEFKEDIKELKTYIKNNLVSQRSQIWNL
ncbi:MAG: hypothetical protein PHN66_01835 [Candidatus Shapirobacteria bacterium]|nr:hypothetical protein [Candidatus Shapirobacteria bacterium]